MIAQWDEGRGRILLGDNMRRGCEAATDQVPVWQSLSLNWTSSYGYAPHNDVSVNDGPHIRQWSHNIIILTTVLQLPTVFSTVT
jgi:hypothetical protein